MINIYGCLLKGNFLIIYKSKTKSFLEDHVNNICEDASIINNIKIITDIKKDLDLEKNNKYLLYC